MAFVQIIRIENIAHTVYMKHILPEMVLHSNAISMSALLNCNGEKALNARAPSTLASKLLTVLQPFADIPQERLPPSFDMGTLKNTL